LLEGKHAFDVVAMNLLAGDRVDDRWLDAEKREGGTAWLGWGDTAEWSDDVGSGFCLPIGLSLVSL
jgi:hypothetical protein